MGVRFLKMAVIYIVVGIGMGITLNFALTSVHAHTNIGESVAGTGILVFAVNVFLYIQETSIAVKKEAHSEKRGLTFD